MVLCSAFCLCSIAVGRLALWSKVLLAVVAAFHGRRCSGIVAMELPAIIIISCDAAATAVI
jgi:hypothetical protein